MDKSQARTAVLGINLVVGVLFVLAPRLGLRLYGVDPDENEAAAYPLRYLGARSLLVAGLLADDDLAGAVLDKAPLIAVGDGVVNVAALLSGEVPKRTVLLGALTSATGSALAFAARDN